MLMKIGRPLRQNGCLLLPAQIPLFPCQLRTELSKRFRCTLPPSTHNKNGGRALMSFIRDKIRVSGPIPVSEFMQMCVGSQPGYYASTEHVFGAQGDFVTSPELTQVFGELVGAWIVHELRMTGWEGEWQLVEMGPGTGALMADILRVLHKFEMTAKLSVHLVERSERLVTRQKASLTDATLRTGERLPPMHWHNSLDDVPQGFWFTVFVANEFLDALPVHLFVRSPQQPDKWCEQYVNLDAQGRLCFMLSKGENMHTRAYIPERIRGNQAHAFWECSPKTLRTVEQMCERFTVSGGFALIIDYGHNGDERKAEHSFRAYKAHQLVDPLQSPGEVDLTADVDFGQLVHTLRDRCLCFGPVEQRRFLGELGLAHRVNYLLQKCTTGEQRRALIDSCKWLMSDAQMGTRFKALSLFPRTLERIITTRGGVPAGFASSQRALGQQRLEQMAVERRKEEQGDERNNGD